MGLSPGDRIDRYEIVELLGAGGMGEVYRARDPKLARLVALKILHVGIAHDTGGAARILREARAAAALSHANVLTVYDVGEVQEPESLRGTAYIAMELVVGHSLRARVGDASVPIEQRVSWLRDVALALGAAHDAGLVHRDVKPENVMIRHDGAVKVLDFGIARRTSPEQWSTDDVHSLPTAPTHRDAAATPEADAPSTAGAGTPFFMAPEQLRGEVLDGRADQFAWGVMAYLLLTGQPPWKMTSDLHALLSQILFVDPTPPREVDPRIPAAAAETIVRTLAKDRDARFPSMAEVARALDGGAKRLGSEARRRVWIAAGALAVAAAAGGLIVRARHGSGAVARSNQASLPAESVKTSPVARRASLAVWPFREVPGGERAAWLGMALGETLRADLSVDGALLVAAGADVAHAKQDLAISDAADLAPADEVRAATALGVPLLVTGSYVVDAAHTIRLDVRVVDAKTGTPLGGATESGKEDDIFDLVERTAAVVRATLHVAAPSPSITELARAAMPAGEDATREYSEGLAALQALDYPVARQRFERAALLDDKAPMPHAMLSRALFELGYIEKAAGEARAAMEHAPGNAVTREDRLAMEARARECAYDWSGAADRWHVLSEFFPDDVEYGLSLARAYKRGGDPKRAIATVESLRTLPGASADPRLDLVASDAASGFDYEAQARYGGAALAKANASGSRSLALEADVAVARATQNLGRKVEEMPETYAAIERRYLDFGNRVGAIQAALRLAYSYIRLSKLDDAMRIARRVIDDAHAYGYVSLEAQGLMRLGWAKRHIDQGSAIPDLVRARDLSKSSGDRWVEEQIDNEIGLARWHSGDPNAGRAMLEESAKIAGAIGQRNDETNALDNLASLYETIGNMRGALTIHEDMAKRYLEMGNRSDWVITLESIATVLLYMGEPAPAGERIDEAASARDQTEAEAAVEIDMVRGQIEIERGQLAEGRALCQRAVSDRLDAGASDLAYVWSMNLARTDVMHGVSRTVDLEKLTAGEAAPPAVVAASRLLDGQRDRAVADARRAIAAALKVQTYMDRVPELVVAGDVLARTGHEVEALALVRPIAADATSRGIVQWALEASLVVARATAPGAARDLAFASVESDARAHGLMDLASRAASARSMVRRE